MQPHDVDAVAGERAGVHGRIFLRWKLDRAGTPVGEVDAPEADPLAVGLHQVPALNPDIPVHSRRTQIRAGLLISNEVQKITPEGVQSPYATFNGAPGSLTAGLVIDDNTGDLFVAYDSVGQNSVIYVVHPDQSQEVFATFPEIGR